MKKITDFIINHRYFILSLFLIFTLLSLFLIPQVSINYDISKYLPDDSKTRLGINKMDDEFREEESSTLNIMFKDLTKDEKSSIKNELGKIKGVQNVQNDDSKEYNKGDYTLYVLTVNDSSTSSKASKVYNQINSKYQDKTFYTSGNISEANKTVLPFWIIALAVGCALIILILMCESFVEPFLFLTTILMAVILNQGTNIIFSDVSHITNSIAAILQMALSMDYSIMLMNRYNQEKSTEKDKVKAMKNALYKSFQSISSSSITTIVGLLALVFMSFKIGKNLGFILAKGVLFSLLSIFFVLPALILIFDKLIIRTKKKSPTINLKYLGIFSYKFRFLSIPLFVLVFLFSFLLKGNLGIDYTDREADQISKVFKETNQIAVIYSNKDEEMISKHLKEWENEKLVREVLGYSNTIGEKLTYLELNDKLKDLESNTSLDDYLLKMIYYDYYNKDESKMTFKELLNFIENEAYKNPTINQKISKNIKTDVTRLRNFVEEDKMNELKTVSDISSILGFEEAKIKDILIYYASKNYNFELTLPQFFKFLNNDVLPNSKYSKNLTSSTVSKLNILTKLTNVQTLQEKLSTDQMANLFEMDIESVKKLYSYYLSTTDIDTKLSIEEFSNFVLNYVKTPDSTLFKEEDLKNIQMLSTFSQKEVITCEMTSLDLANLLGIPKEDVNSLFLLKHLNDDNKKEYKLLEFIDKVLFLKENTSYLEDIDSQVLMSLKLSPDVQNDDRTYTYLEMSQVLGLDTLKVKQIYNLLDEEEWRDTPLDFVKFVLDQNLAEETTTKLDLLLKVMNSSLSSLTFSYQDLASFLSLDNSQIKGIYILYLSYQNEFNLTPEEFVNFILAHHQDEALKNQILSSTLKELELAKNIITSCLTNKTYRSQNLVSLLGISKENIDLLYGLYDSIYLNPNRSLSLKELISFLLNDMVLNKDYANQFDEDKISKLNTLNYIMNNPNNKYNSSQIFTVINSLSEDASKQMIDLLYLYYSSSYKYQEKWQMTIEEFVNYLNDSILKDERFKDFIEDEMRNNISSSKTVITDLKKELVGRKYSRVVLNTNFNLEGDATFKFVKKLQSEVGKNNYVIGDSPMAYEMSLTFNDELNLITIITMISIFIVVMFTFYSLLIPTLLVFTIQCAVYLTMGILSLTGDNVYFISLLIVQSILMGATIDYAILYTSYYLENRKTLNRKEAVIASYNKSIHTILTSSSILIIVTLIIACFASLVASRICKTISQGTLCSTLLILLLLPSILVLCDKFIVKKDKRDY